MRLSFVRLFVPLALALLAGCGTSPERRLDAPATTITGLRTTKKDGRHLVVRLTNTNTVPLVIKRSTHQLHLGAQKLARFEDREPIGVPPLGAVTHTIKLPSEVAANVRAWLDAHPGGTSVTLESAFEVIVGTEDDTVTLKSTGRGTL